MDAEPIRSRTNPLVRRLRALKERETGDEAGLCLVEGPTLLEEAIRASVDLVEVVISDDHVRRARGRALAAAARERGCPVHLLDAALLASLSETETSQGVLALARRPRPDEARILAATPLVLVAVAVQNPGNLGGLLRTAEAAGATGAYLAEGCADPFSWKALRGSMGSAFRLPLQRRVSLPEVLTRLAARGVATVATAAGAGALYDQIDLRRPVALLFGSEGRGLPPGVAARADHLVSIPLREPVESLNVGVAAGVLLFEAARQRRRA